MDRVGNQVPTYSWCGSYTRTEGKFAVALADAYGLAPHPWQRTVLNDWLALDDDGKLLNSLCVLPVPRQNGKTGVCDPRETWGLIHRGERILHTAQEYQTAKKAFDRLREKFGACRNDPNAKFPELNRKVDRYTTSANQMVLDLDNGGHIEFRTRGSSGDMGRGGTFDLIVVDEAQCYTEEQDSALSPLNSAAPTGSPQTILMGTVPDPTKSYKGEKFAAIRAMMHDNPCDNSCIHEWGASEIGDVDDVSRWYEFNPSLGYQLLVSGLEKDARTMSPDAFAREHLGWWPVRELSPNVIGEKEWTACRTENPPADGLLCFAVKFPPDGSTGTIAACLKPKDGSPYIEVVKSKSLVHGIGWIVDFLAERKDKAAQIVIDGQSNGQTLYDRLIERHVPSKAIVKPSAREFTAACAWLLNAVREGQIEHFGQPALDASATRTRKRIVGKSGGWGFESTEDGDACLIEACALAYWAAMTTKRDPTRKVVIY